MGGKCDSKVSGERDNDPEASKLSLGVGAWQAYSMQHSDRRKHTQAKI